MSLHSSDGFDFFLLLLFVLSNAALKCLAGKEVQERDSVNKVISKKN